MQNRLGEEIGEHARPLPPPEQTLHSLDLVLSGKSKVDSKINTNLCGRRDHAQYKSKSTKCGKITWRETTSELPYSRRVSAGPPFPPHYCRNLHYSRGAYGLTREPSLTRAQKIRARDREGAVKRRGPKERVKDSSNELVPKEKGNSARIESRAAVNAT